MNILILSYFERKLGPIIFFHKPETKDIENLKIIPALMDLHETGFFVHIAENLKISNLIFTIPSEFARGKLELLQISIVVEKDREFDMTLTRDLLEGFVNEVNNIERCFEAFYGDSDLFKVGRDKFYELKTLFNSYSKSIEPAIRALEAAELKYRELVENANSIILKWDFDGKIMYINPYGEKVFGYRKEELKEKHVIGTITPEKETSGRDLQKLIDEICANPDVFEKNENENITKEGKKVWIFWSNKALRDEEGNITGVLSIGQDITDHKQG